MSTLLEKELEYYKKRAEAQPKILKFLAEIAPDVSAEELMEKYKVKKDKWRST